MITPKRPVLGRGVHKAKNSYMVICMYKCVVPSLGVSILHEGTLFQVGVFVSKGGCVPINKLENRS